MKTKFGFLTDTHFIFGRNNFRTDDFYKSTLSKFTQCYDWFKKQGCSFVVHGGDFFDKHKTNSFQMLLDLRDAIVSSGLKTYYIWGQHDLSGYNRGSKKDSSLHFLTQICDGNLIEIENETVIDGIRFCPVHVDLEPIEVLRKIEKKDMPTVAVVHALLYLGNGAPGTIDVRKIGPVNTNMVLSGDLHGGFCAATINDTCYLNPGSLARTSREERRPKALTVEFLNNGEYDLDYFYPKCADYPFPEIEEEIKVVEEPERKEEYVQAFEKFKSESKDIFECLEKAGLELGIEKNVIDYVMSKKGSV